MKPKTIDLPKPKWCTAEELSESWGISISLVRRYTQASQLHLSTLYEYVDDEGNSHLSWLLDICDKVDEEVYLLEGWSVAGLYYKQEEIERFLREKPSSGDCEPTTKNSIGTKERGTWLKIIYLLAAKLAATNKISYKKNNGSFNFLQFETELKDVAKEHWPQDHGRTASTNHGLSNDNLKKILEEAENFFNHSG